LNHQGQVTERTAGSRDARQPLEAMQACKETQSSPTSGKRPIAGWWHTEADVIHQHGSVRADTAQLALVLRVDGDPGRACGAKPHGIRLPTKPVRILLRPRAVACRNAAILVQAVYQGIVATGGDVLRCNSSYAGADGQRDVNAWQCVLQRHTRRIKKSAGGGGGGETELARLHTIKAEPPRSSSIAPVAWMMSKSIMRISRAKCSRSCCRWCRQKLTSSSAPPASPTLYLPNRDEEL